MSSTTKSNILARKSIFTGMILLLIIAQFSLWNASAQESTPDPNPTITVNGVTPTQVMAQQAATISVTGENFTDQSRVSLNGVGELQTQMTNATTLSATMPTNIAPGQYGVTVSDPARAVDNGSFTVNVLAQAVPQITRFSPTTIVVGTSSTYILTVTGSGFVPGTTARLVNGAPVQTIRDSDTQLRVIVSGNITVGPYLLEVTNPQGNSDVADETLFVVTPSATPITPQPTQQIPTNEPPPTSPPPTPIPGEPSLVGRNFAANPSTIQPGGSSALTFELVNQGNRTAQGVSVTLDPSGSFFAANGQASVLLPDIAPGGVVTVTFGVTAGAAVEAGPASVPFTVAYRDFEGEAKTSTVTLTVTIGESDPETSLVTLSRYMAQPSPVQPGQPVILTLLFTNSGSSPAVDVVARIATGEGSVLLAGPQGDAFPLGDIPAGGSASVEMPLVVAPGAKAGPQAQTINLTFISGGEAKEATSSITLDVEAAEVAAPVLLLDSYETGADVLQPGDTFTLTLNFKNVGTAPADDLLVTFGTVESSSGGGDGGSGGGSGGGTGSGSSSSTTPSNTFAPLGSGGTLFAGTLAADGELLTLTQDFIVSGSVTSGIYSLPITLRYAKADGTTAQETLRASLVVLMPPQLQTVLQQPIPSEVFQGDLLLIGLALTNIGQKSVEFRSMTITTDNGEVIEGADMPLSTLPKEEELVISGVVIPAELGAVKVTVTLNYLNELNQPDTLVFEYESTVIEAPVIEEPGGFEPPVIETPPPTEEPSSDDLLGRLLLGLLGLGS